jgi:hypothetical protein
VTGRFGGRERVQISDVLKDGSGRRGVYPRQASDEDQKECCPTVFWRFSQDTT